MREVGDIAVITVRERGHAERESGQESVRFRKWK